MKQIKFWILLLLLLILVPNGFNYQSAPTSPVKIDLFKEFDALKLEIADPLAFVPQIITNVEAIYKYEPSQKIAIPDNYRLIAQKENIPKVKILPFIDSHEDKETNELEVFLGLTVNATF